MKVHVLEGEVIGVRLDWRNLPDLDAAMLDILTEAFREGDTVRDRYEDDEPTRLPVGGEPDWEWTRISPCPANCEEHGWHWDSRILNDDLPLDEHPARRFLAMRFGE